MSHVERRIFSFNGMQFITVLPMLYLIIFCQHQGHDIVCFLSKVFIALTFMYLINSAIEFCVWCEVSVRICGCPSDSEHALLVRNVICVTYQQTMEMPCFLNLSFMGLIGLFYANTISHLSSHIF